MSCSMSAAMRWCSPAPTPPFPPQLAYCCQCLAGQSEKLQRNYVISTNLQKNDMQHYDGVCTPISWKPRHSGYSLSKMELMWILFFVTIWWIIKTRHSIVAIPLQWHTDTLTALDKQSINTYFSRPVARHVQGVRCTRAPAYQGLLIPENKELIDGFKNI